MIERATNLLRKKHLLIIGKSETEAGFRKRYRHSVRVGDLPFPKKMKSLDEYLDFVKKEKLYRPWYEKKGRFNGNQILDFHFDWISKNDVLVVMEEFQEMEEVWRIELLRIYMNEVENRKTGTKIIHLVVSQDDEDGLFEMLSRRIDFGNHQHG